MKILNKPFVLLIFSFLFVLTSCRKEESEFIDTPPEDTIEPNSSVLNLMLRTATNDGSNDNIIDYANCFNIVLPIVVTANSNEIDVYTDSDFDMIESIFDENDDDTDTLIITFPITIVLTDFTEVILNDNNELITYASTCNGENIDDDDIECIDFIYPISASTFNVNSELLITEVFINDSELYNFFNGISEDDIINLNFPISVLLSDNSQIQINSLSELEETIENHQNDCDEDDDYDYNDDDCDFCTADELESILVSCSNWSVDKLERLDVDYDDEYEGYDFNFFSDGTLSVYWNATTVYGTWSTSGTENNITVVIDIPALPLCNHNWILHEIETSGNATKIDLREGDDDRLRYENTCN